MGNILGRKLQYVYLVAVWNNRQHFWFESIDDIGGILTQIEAVWSPNKDLFHHWQNVSNSTLYPDVLKIKTNCCVRKFYKNANLFII